MLNDKQITHLTDLLAARLAAAMFTEPLTGAAFLAAWREGELGGTGRAVVEEAVVFVAAAAEVPRPTETERCCDETADEILLVIEEVVADVPAAAVTRGFEVTAAEVVPTLTEEAEGCCCDDCWGFSFVTVGVAAFPFCCLAATGIPLVNETPPLALLLLTMGTDADLDGAEGKEEELVELEIEALTVLPEVDATESDAEGDVLDTFALPDVGLLLLLPADWATLVFLLVALDAPVALLRCWAPPFCC